MCRAVLEETWANPSTLADVVEANGTISAWNRHLVTRKCFVSQRGSELVGVGWVFVADRIANDFHSQLYRLSAEMLPSNAAELETLARLWQREKLLKPVALFLDASDLTAD